MATTGATQEILGFTDIRDDVVCLPRGHRAVLEVDGINFEMKSIAERRQVLAGFARLLNALEFRAQFLVRVRPLDIGDYLRSVEARLPELPPPLVVLALDHVAHVRGLIAGRRAMRQHCYLIVPAGESPRPADRRPAWRRAVAGLLGVPATEPPPDLGTARASLNFRCAEVGKHLGLMGLTSRRLAWPELVELFHGCWNPGLAGSEHLRRQLADVTGLIAALDASASGPIGPEPPPAA
jgi:hypothetical protein